jgi:hypothetical protein
MTYEPTPAEIAAREKSHAQALKLWELLKEVNELRIPVMARDRYIPRKEQARLARELFKRLGLKGLGARVTRGFNCSTVHIKVPRLQHSPEEHKTNWRDTGNCQACKFDRYARDKLDEILARAFPQHDDRSDSQSDYFDFKWFIY